MTISKYFGSLFSSKKLSKHISLFSFWDHHTRFSKEIYLGAFSRIENTTIGNYTRIKPLCNIFNAEIGKYCSIAKGTKIGLGKHPTYLLSTNSIFYKQGISDSFARPIDFNEFETVHIGNDVWIGLESVIMDGVTIGDGAIIAARSVVTKDVPPYSIVGGAPAKVIKYRFDQAIIDLLLKIKWWELNDDEIKEKLSLFTKENLSIDDIKYHFKEREGTVKH